jgi:hypothetical protein
MTSCPTFKALTVAFGLATTVYLAPDASALSGSTGTAMVESWGATPLLEVVRERSRDHRRNPTSCPKPCWGGGHPKNRKVPPKGGNVPWKKKHPSRI